MMGYYKMPENVSPEELENKIDENRLVREILVRESEGVIRDRPWSLLLQLKNMYLKLKQNKQYKKYLDFILKNDNVYIIIE
ncbi:MAG: hypothetical protein ACI4EH_08715 [Oliverpabstia sp.]